MKRVAYGEPKNNPLNSLSNSHVAQRPHRLLQGGGHVIDAVRCVMLPQDQSVLNRFMGKPPSSS
jgi:hypothetical protein